MGITHDIHDPARMHGHDEHGGSGGQCVVPLRDVQLGSPRMATRNLSEFVRARIGVVSYR